MERWKVCCVVQSSLHEKTPDMGSAGSKLISALGSFNTCFSRRQILCLRLILLLGSCFQEPNGIGFHGSSHSSKTWDIKISSTCLWSHCWVDYYFAGSMLQFNSFLPLLWRYGITKKYYIPQILYIPKRLYTEPQYLFGYSNLQMQLCRLYNAYLLWTKESLRN